MMELEQVMQQQVFAVVGNTIQQDKFAAKIKNGLLEHGYTVYSVGKELSSLNAIPEQIDIIDLCIHPVKGLALMKEFTGSCKCVVIQEGAESPELITYLREKKIPFMQNCLLIGLRLYGNSCRRVRSVLCFGDSNTYGYNPYNGLRYPKEIRWTARLQSLLGDRYQVLEQGCNGRTTCFSTPGEEWKNGVSAIWQVMNTAKPVDIVILALGSNDLKEIFHTKAEDCAAGAGKIVDAIREFASRKQQYQPDIILVAPPLITEGITEGAFGVSFTDRAVRESRRFAECYHKVAKEKHCLFWNAAACTLPSEQDHLHLDVQGHKVYAEELRNVIWQIRHA